MCLFFYYYLLLLIFFQDLLPHQISEAANMYGQQMMCVNKVAIELHPHCFTRHIVEAFFPHILYK